MPHDKKIKKYHYLPHITGVNIGQSCMKNDVCVLIWKACHPRIKYFKENIHKISWRCLLLPVWNAVVNVG